MPWYVWLCLWILVACAGLTWLLVAVNEFVIVPLLERDALRRFREGRR